MLEANGSVLFVKSQVESDKGVGGIIGLPSDWRIVRAIVVDASK